MVDLPQLVRSTIERLDTTIRKLAAQLI